MNFEGFQDLIRRVATEWYKLAKKDIIEMEMVDAYLEENPFTAKQTPENEIAYERLMDVRMKLYELSYEIDKNHDSYMEFMQQCLDSPDLLDRVTEGLTNQEKHLINLELLIMEQVADWEVGTGRTDQESNWTKSKKMVVSLPDGKTRTIGISQEFECRYWFSICPVSHKIGNLKMCGGCKQVGYLGKDEQKEDWPNHKNLCKILQSVIGKGLSSQQMVTYLTQKLGRPLNQFELDLTNFPRVCAVCQSDKHDVLKNCKSCFCVAFCPSHFEEGKSKHEEFCELLKIAAEDYKNEKTLGHQVQHYVPKTRTKYDDLPDNIEVFFSKDVSELVSNKLPGYQESELRYLTFLYTCPLSILYGIEKSGLKGGVSVKDVEELTIHLAGVRIAEMRHFTGWEIFCHRLPKLLKLTLVFIGDECPTGQFPKDFTYKSKDVQQDRSKDLTIRYVLFPKFYQDYAKLSTFIKPDVVAALDCGFKFYPSWLKALPLMLQEEGVPLIFTEFNQQDTEDNLELIRRNVDGTEVCFPPQRNPYSSLRPVRCSDKTGNYKPNSVIFTNDYICIVRRKL